MLLIICVERLPTSHWQPLFSKKMRRRPHFPTKLAAVASFSYKIGGGGLLFLQNWQQRQGFCNITGGYSDMVWILSYWLYLTEHFGKIDQSLQTGNIEVRGAILGSPGASRPGAGFFNNVGRRGWTCQRQVMHSG